MAKASKRPSGAADDAARAIKRQKVQEALPEVEDFPRGHAQVDRSAPKRKLAALDDIEDVSLFSTQPAKASVSLDEQIRQRKRLEKKKVAHRLEEAKKTLAEKENAAPTHVSYKRLIPGSRLLACITQISDNELTVSLPNLMSGHLPLHRAFREEAGEDSDAEEDEDERRSLAKSYRVGQMLVVAVVAVLSMQEVRATSTLKSFELDNKVLASSRRVELTLDPQVIYEGISADELAPNFPVNACVASKEDAGYVLNVGVGNVTAFLSFADAEAAFGDVDLQTGAYLPARVTKMHQSKRTCSLSFEPFPKSAVIDREIAIDAVLPGMLVKARVTAVEKGNVTMRFLGLFDGTIDAVHLAHRDNLEKRYQIGQQVKARVLAALPWQSSKTFTLSDLPHLVAGRTSISAAVPTGTIVEDALVTHVERHWGLLLDLPNAAGPSVPAFAPIAEISDERIDQLPLDGPFAQGSQVMARVIAFSALSGTYTVSMRESVLERRFMSASEVQVGQHIEGIVQRLTTEALFVSIGSSNDAIVWSSHLSDTRLKHPERKFRTGSKVKARVFSIDAKRNRVSLTLKPSLVSSTLPIVESLQEVAPGSRLAAIVSKMDTKGASFELFGGSRVFVPLADLSDDFVEKPEQAVSLGKSVELRVTGVAGGHVRATLRTKVATKAVDEAKTKSLRHAAGLAVSTLPIDVEELEVGAVLPVRLVKRDMHGWLVQLSPNLRGRVHWTDVADDFDTAATLSENQVVKAAIVQIDTDAARIDVSLRASLASAADGNEARDAVFVDASDLQTGMRIRGFVVNIARAGLFVAIARHVTARVQIKELFDEFVEDWQSRFQQGQVVEGTLLNVDTEKQQVEMRLRSGASVKSKADGMAWPALQEDQQVRCHVKAFRQYGVLLAIEDSYISGLCHKTQMGQYKQEAMQVGQKLTAVIVGVDQDKRRVSFSLDFEVEKGSSEVGLGVEHDMVSDDDGQSIDITLTAVVPPKVAIVRPQKKAAPALSLPTTFAWTDEGDVAEPSIAAPIAPAPVARPRKSAAVAEDAPASKVDFEQQVISSPDSSATWISYMNFCLDAADVNEARQIAKRALDAINYREEEEKLNVWMALLKLELDHGSETSFDAAFAEAVQFNDPWSVHLRLADAFELSGQFSRVAPMLTRSTSKFSTNVAFWLRLAKAYFRDSQNDAAHETLQRSLKSLSSKQHVEMISRFAQLEFKHGDPERGRTLFEGVLDRAPKRLDLWSIYADMEEQAQNLDGARSIYGRMLERKVSSKKAKFVLKKWHAFEKEHGTPADIEAVRQRAVAFVQGQDEEAESP